MISQQDRPTPPEIDAESENTESEITVPAVDTASGREEERTTEQARQGHTGDHVRYILIVSITGLVIVFAIAYFLFFR